MTTGTWIFLGTPCPKSPGTPQKTDRTYNPTLMGLEL